MGYGVYDEGHRWAGYMVPAECDFPDCPEMIDRGLGYKCEMHGYWEDDDTFIELDGCGLFFCTDHAWDYESHDAIEPKGDHPKWLWWILSSPSWKQWREESPKLAAEYERLLLESGWRPSKGDLEALFYELDSETYDG
jgi:hypothetical protein